MNDYKRGYKDGEAAYESRKYISEEERNFNSKEYWKGYDDGFHNLLNEEYYNGYEVNND